MKQSLATLIALNLNELRLPDDYNYIAQEHTGDIYVSIDKPEFTELVNDIHHLATRKMKQVNRIALPVANDQSVGFITRSVVDEILNASFVGSDFEIYHNPSPEAMTYQLVIDDSGGYTWSPVKSSDLPESIQVIGDTL